MFTAHTHDWLIAYKVDGLEVSSLGQARTVTLLREKPIESAVELVVWRPDAARQQATSRSSSAAPCDTTCSTTSDATFVVAGVSPSLLPRPVRGATSAEVTAVHTVSCVHSIFRCVPTSEAPLRFAFSVLWTVSTGRLHITLTHFGTYRTDAICDDEDCVNGGMICTRSPSCFAATLPGACDQPGAIRHRAALH